MFDEPSLKFAIVIADRCSWLASFKTTVYSSVLRSSSSCGSPLFYVRSYRSEHLVRGSGGLLRLASEPVDVLLVEDVGLSAKARTLISLRNSFSVFISFSSATRSMRRSCGLT